MPTHPPAAVPPAASTVPAAWRERPGGARPVELTILMPCLDEAETIALCIAKAASFLARSGIAGEIVVADNGSTDGSREIARALGARVVPVAARGYGAALSGGIEAARGRFVIMGDADDSYDFEELDAFVAELRAGHDLVMGNRFRGGIAAGAMPALHRYLGNPVLSFVGTLLFRAPVGDFHCGLRGFSRDAIRSLRLSTPGMEFASEMVVRASLAGLSVAEVPTTLKPDGRSRPPHLRSWRDGWRHLKLLLTLAPNWLFLGPGALLAGSGLALAAMLAPGPLSVAGAVLDGGALVFAVAAALVGAQLVGFYALAKVHGVEEGILPESARHRRMRARLGVDRLCLAGLAAGLVGLGTAAAAAGWWAARGFGPLHPGTIVRLAAFSALGLALGVQLATTGFLLDLLGRRRADAAPPVPADASADPVAEASVPIGRARDAIRRTGT